LLQEKIYIKAGGNENTQVKGERWSAQIVQFNFPKELFHGMRGKSNSTQAATNLWAAAARRWFML